MRFYSYNSEPTETMQQLAALNRFLLCKLKTLVEEPPRIRGTEEEEKTERKRKKQRLKESGRSKRRRAFKKRLRRSKGFYGQTGCQNPRTAFVGYSPPPRAALHGFGGLRRIAKDA